jgi:hypothetical protein
VISPGHLKLELAVRGARLDDSVRRQGGVVRPVAHDAQARTVELVLPDDVWVTVPVDEPSLDASPYLITAEGDRYFVAGEPLGATGRSEVRAVPIPAFYARNTSRGTPMRRIASVHGSHLVVHPGAACGFSVRGAPCRFCVEGARPAADRDAASVTEVLEVVRAAFDEGVVESVYLNTGVFDAEDGGIAFLAPYVRAVRKHFDTLIATQVHPPHTNQWIDRTYAMGVDALSYNLEIFDPEALERHCVGRARYVGRERYLEALGYAASIFPSGTVWSDLVLGMESVESTLAGIDALVAMGVVPVAALARGEHPGVDPAAVGPLLAHLYQAVKGRGINMGWVRGLALCITPLEARHFAGDGARLAVTVQNMTRWRLGALAARGLARFRRRLRVRNVGESFDSAHL